MHMGLRPMPHGQCGARPPMPNSETGCSSVSVQRLPRQKTCIWVVAHVQGHTTWENIFPTEMPPHFYLGINYNWVATRDLFWAFMITQLPLPQLKMWRERAKSETIISRAIERAATVLNMQSSRAINLTPEWPRKSLRYPMDPQI